MSQLDYLKFMFANFRRNYRNTPLLNAVSKLRNSDDPVADRFLYNINREFEAQLVNYENQVEELARAERLAGFKNKHRGEDCFIIGNGPSLNKIDLEKLNDHYTFGMNKIYLIFKRVNLSLSYYVSVNPLVIQQSSEQIDRFSIPCFLSKTACKDHMKYNENVFLIDTCGDTKTFEKDISKKIPEGYTVTFVALQIAYYMGFDRVFLVGVDHNFIQQGNPNEEQLHKGPDVNHFDPSYFQNNLWHLADLEGSELFYKCADFFYKRDGRQIYDATPDGKLKVFPKIAFDEALAMARKQ